MFQIEKNVAIPPVVRNGRPIGEPKYPLAKMEVGESFFVPINRKTEQKSLSASCHVAAKKLGRKFVTRTVLGGVRVWRVE